MHFVCVSWKNFHFLAEESLGVLCSFFTSTVNFVYIYIVAALSFFHFVLQHHVHTLYAPPQSLPWLVYQRGARPTSPRSWLATSTGLALQQKVRFTPVFICMSVCACVCICMCAIVCVCTYMYVLYKFAFIFLCATNVFALEIHVNWSGTDFVFFSFTSSWVCLLLVLVQLYV